MYGGVGTGDGRGAGCLMDSVVERGPWFSLVDQTVSDSEIRNKG